jgi:hypothetical protein
MERGYYLRRFGDSADIGARWQLRVVAARRGMACLPGARMPVVTSFWGKTSVIVEFEFATEDDRPRYKC